MNVDLVLILSGWLFGLIMATFATMMFLQNRKMKAEIVAHNEKYKNKLTIPEDIDPEELTKGIIGFLDVFWNNPHLKRRAEKIHDNLAPALKAWNDEE